MIVTIVVLGIVLIPLGFMSMEYMRGITYSRDLTIAEGLARLEMSKINNLAYDDSTLEDGDDDTSASYEGYPYDMRRTVSYVAGWSNNLKKAQVRVYPTGDSTNHLVDLVTYIADVAYGAGSGGGAAATTGDADSLTVSGGSISGTDLQNVTLQNTSGDSITIEGITISFTGTSGLKLRTITMDGSERWSGTVSSGQSLTFDTNFTLSASTTYSNTGLFEFSKNLTSVTSLVFIMSDGSETGSYSW